MMTDYTPKRTDSLMIKRILLLPFTLFGFVITFYFYRKSNSNLTYKKWIIAIMELWVSEGKPRGKSLEYMKRGIL